MPVFVMKSILSLFIVLSALFALFTMLEVFGRGEKKYSIDRLKKLHRANGMFYILLYMVTAYFCLKFIMGTKAELSSRAVFHSVFALTVIVLLTVKVLFVRVYRQFYGQARTVGLVVALMTFGMVGTSGGYYLLITKFGTESAFKGVTEYKKEYKKEAKKGEIKKIAVRTDSESINRGMELYESKCFSCHAPHSTETIGGPGHRGILKNPVFPVSKRPATPENAARQIREPFNRMPAFDYLTDEEIEDIIAYLNTL